MTTRTRRQRTFLATLLAPSILLSGCFGDSRDKGDNGGSIITPKPSTVEDANTAGDRKSPLPMPPKVEAKPDSPAEPTPK